MRASRAAAEAVLFLFAAGAGVYGLGRGLATLFDPGRGVGGAAWLAVVAVALWVLAGQMGRVHDTWAHRRPVGRRVNESGGAGAASPQEEVLRP